MANCSIAKSQHTSVSGIRQKLIDQHFLNDGTSGFRRKWMHAKNFNTLQSHTGIFDRTMHSVPQINIINLHGSVYWSKSEDRIEVDYNREPRPLLSTRAKSKIQEFSDYLENADGITARIPEVTFSTSSKENFWEAYNELPIVNPTKWKFHETVFEEHYYQMLRLMSYELERPNSILITFGFSFADEHILRLVQRSLANPALQAYFCTYSQAGTRKLKKEFSACPNVEIIGPPDGEMLNFENFNRYVFSLNPEQYTTPEGDTL